jgi:hypothetical protein
MSGSAVTDDQDAKAPYGIDCDICRRAVILAVVGRSGAVSGVSREHSDLARLAHIGSRRVYH